MIKAMTLTQPWASMVASGIKLIENRPWRAPRSMVGEQFAIHASRSYDLATSRDLFINKLYGADIVSPYPTSRDFPLSAIIGVATLDRVEHAVGEFTGADLDALGISRDQHRWFFGPYGFVLRDVRQVAPIPCKGALSFWRLGDDIEAKLRAQLRAVAA